MPRLEEITHYNVALMDQIIALMDQIIALMDQIIALNLEHFWK